jgi:hypothetical protein
MATVIRTALRATTTTGRNPSKCTNFAALPTTRTDPRMISLRTIKDPVLDMTAMLLVFPRLEVLRPIRIVIVVPPTTSTSVTMRPQLSTSRPDHDPHRASALIPRRAMAATDKTTMPITIGARRGVAIVVVVAPEWLQIENSSKATALLHPS